MHSDSRPSDLELRGMFGEGLCGECWLGMLVLGIKDSGNGISVCVGGKIIRHACRPWGNHQIQLGNLEKNDFLGLAIMGLFKNQELLSDLFFLDSTQM